MFLVKTVSLQGHGCTWGVPHPLFPCPCVRLSFLPVLCLDVAFRFPGTGPQLLCSFISQPHKQCGSTASRHHGKKRPLCACPLSPVAPVTTGDKPGCNPLPSATRKYQEDKDTLSMSAHQHEKHCCFLSLPHPSNTFPIFTDKRKLAYSMLQSILSAGLTCIFSSRIWSGRETARLTLEVRWDIFQLFGGSGRHNFSVAVWFCQACFYATLKCGICA